MDAEPRPCLKESGQLLGLSWVPNQPSTGEGCGESFTLLSGKASGTWSPKKLTPNTSFCIANHQLMDNISLEVKGKKSCLDAAEKDVLQHG